MRHDSFGYLRKLVLSLFEKIDIFFNVMFAN
jgi:hypothetical protein